METAAYRVRIVIDPDFGRRLADVPAGEPVWIVESAANTPVAKGLWAQRPAADHLTGTRHDVPELLRGFDAFVAPVWGLVPVARDGRQRRPQPPPSAPSGDEPPRP